MSTVASPIEKLKIGDVEVYLEDFGESKGKIIISNTNGTSYSYYWNAMGGSLKDFLCQLNGDYLARCLIGTHQRLVADWRKHSQMLGNISEKSYLYHSICTWSFSTTCGVY